MDTLFDAIPAPYVAESDTSTARAKREDADGTTSRRQTQTLKMLGEAPIWGLTWRELAAAFNWHHGQASAVLSTLHKHGHIVPLRQTRNNCHPYILATDAHRHDPANVIWEPAKTYATRRKEALEAVAAAARTLTRIGGQNAATGLVNALAALDALDDQRGGK